MHSFEYILVMLGAVLLSNLISQRFTRISTPLVQIGLGIAIALVPFFHFDMTLDSELFLALFIAPLLFEDAKKANKPMLWRLKRPILLLALGLVFTTCLVAGSFINWLVPAIPLAAAIALAAALAPTDAVAVSSLKESVTISEDQEGLLQGEALFNDASSIVSFQFALAALAVGPFAAAAGQPELIFFGDVVITFLFMFVGGVAVGVVLMLLRYALVRFLRSHGIDSITFHVLFEVLTPFLVFLIAESLHVSGIIAVVVAGIAHSFGGKRQTPAGATQNIVSSSVWSMIAYALNGVVFLILGTQLPGLTMDLWQFSGVGHTRLIVAVVGILAAIMLLRFVWVFVMHRNRLICTTKPVVDDFDDDDGAANSDTKIEDAALTDVLVDDSVNTQVNALVNASGKSQVSASVDALTNASASTLLNGSAKVLQEPSTAFVTRITAAATAGLPVIDEKLTTIEEMAQARQEQREQAKERAKAESKQAQKAAIIAERCAPDYLKRHVHDALVLTLTGVKGAITLALLLTIPLYLSDGSEFPERNLLLFLASGIIVLSLLLANFVVPIIAPKAHEPLQPQDERRSIMDIYHFVIRDLAENMTSQNKQATEQVIRQYNNRLIALKQNNDIADPEETALRKRIIGWEREHTLKLIDENRISFLAGSVYLYQLSRLLAHIEHHGEKRWFFLGWLDQIKHRLTFARAYRRKIAMDKSCLAQDAAQDVSQVVSQDVKRASWRGSKQDFGQDSKQDITQGSRQELEQCVDQDAKRNIRQGSKQKKQKIKGRSMIITLQELQRVNYRYVLRRLDTLMAEDGAPIRVINMVVGEFRRRLSRMENSARPLAQLSHHKDVEFEEQIADIKAMAMISEREAIKNAQDHNRISRETAGRLFDNVAMMELDIEEHLE